jgi:hypothetical protein
MARGLPFQLSAATTLGALLLAAPERVPGLWVFFGMDLFLGVALVASFLRATRSLRGTAPEQRGTRSDDKALAKAQRSVGCLPFVPVAALIVWVLSAPQKRAAVASLALHAFGACVVGHLAGVVLISWARRSHREGAQQ